MPTILDVRNVIAAAGGEQAIELSLRRFQEDVRYLHSLQQELLQKYLDQWVAVYERNLVAHGKTLPEVRRQLSKKQIPQSEVAMEFIARERKAMLL